MKILSFLTFLLCASSFAGREVVLPHVVRRATFQYKPVDVDNPKALGAVLTALVSVKNLSSIPQTVTVYMDEGSYAYANTMDTNICLAVTGDESHIVRKDGLATVPADNEPRFQLKLGAKKTNWVTMTASFKTLDPYAERILTALFYPTIRIEVEEDKGAVMATMAMHSELPAGMDKSPCKLPLTSPPRNFTVDMPAPLNQASPVVTFNGGRPF